MGKYVDAVLAFAQGGTPTFEEVSFPTQSDLSQENKPLRGDNDFGDFSFSDCAQDELDSLPPLSKISVQNYLTQAAVCLRQAYGHGDSSTPGDDENAEREHAKQATKYLGSAISICHLNTACQLEQEIYNHIRDIELEANETPSGTDLYYQVHGTPDQSSRESMSAVPGQGVDAGLTAGPNTAKILALANVRAYEREDRGRLEHVGAYTNMLGRKFSNTSSPIAPGGQVHPAFMMHHFETATHELRGAETVHQNAMLNMYHEAGQAAAEGRETDAMRNMHSLHNYASETGHHEVAADAAHHLAMIREDRDRDAHAAASSHVTAANAAAGRGHFHVAASHMQQAQQVLQRRGGERDSEPRLEDARPAGRRSVADSLKDSSGHYREGALDDLSLRNRRR